MGRKAVISGGKRDEIIEAARKMFFEKGFDGVTIRNLQKEVGCEVGLFYYYFKSKDEIFDVVIDRLEGEWRNELDEVAEDFDDNPKACIERLFAAVARIASDFRREGGRNLHWSVQSGIYDRLIGLAEEFSVQILENMGARGFSVKEQAAIVAGGLGRIAVGENNGNGYKERIDYVLSAAGIQDYSYNRRREISVELL
ncbi:MAG: TetR/AcrR family transcriptional regulator [Clostridia bacterium]|nr:TetR/AcrR family transcriptional regulator [Clostridia bacterium]